MKCPKCGYLGFGEVERCRNCGYDLTMSSSADLAIRPWEDEVGEINIRGPLDDLDIVEPRPSSRFWSSTRPPGGAQATASAVATPVVITTASTPEALASPAPHADLQPVEDLPLFGSPEIDDVPLITRPSPPRKPLAVRRSVPEVPRLRLSADARPPMLDLAGAEATPDRRDASSERSWPPAARDNRIDIRAESRADAWADALGDVRHDAPPNAMVPAVATPSAEVSDGYGVDPELASVGARATAAAIDVTILLSIDIIIIYLTLKVCGIGVDDFRLLPKVPLVAFLGAQNLAYLIGFTINGQTLGKMAAGIKVVGTADRALDAGHAVLRTLVWVALAVPAGLGFATALFGRERRGLHDRCAGTRVVRASA